MSSSSERCSAVRGMVLAGTLLVACTGGLRQGGTQAPPYRVAVPLGLDLVAPVPEDNTITEAKIALGEMLFFDSALSADETLSCASCHQPTHHFTDGRPRAVGLQGREGTRNVPSVLNSAYGRSFLWDGSVSSLEEQVLRPIQGKAELGLELDQLLRRLSGQDIYRAAFRNAFGRGEISENRVARALATYLRSLRSGDAPVDRFLHGDAAALSASARRGFRLFVGRANCGTCHLAPLFTDHELHNTGVSWGSPDLGSYTITGREEDRGMFKTPSLRNVAMTAPYMHDGSILTLEAVIEHYERGGTPNPNLDEEIVPLRLTPQERADLIAFLESLTGEAPGAY